MLQILPIYQQWQQFSIRIFQEKNIVSSGFSNLERAIPKRIKFPMFAFLFPFDIPSVRVGLFIPSLEIKISFVAFHFRCLIQSSQLHSIRSMDHLAVGYFRSYPSCLVPAGSGLFIKVHQNHFTVIYSPVWSFGGKRVFLGFFSLIRFRFLLIQSSKCPIIPTGT